jgi:hypothetical protein
MENQRLDRIKHLWLAVFNDPVLTVEEAAREFFYDVGHLLEGKTLEQLEYRRIDRNRVLQHARES